MPMFPFLLLALVSSLFGLTDTGQFYGTVVDANGAVVVGAAVKLTSQSTSQAREAVTVISSKLLNSHGNESTAY